MATVDNRFVTKEEGVGFIATYYSDMPFSLSIFDYDDNFLCHVDALKQPESVADLKVTDQNDLLSDEILQKVYNYLSDDKNWKRFSDGAIVFFKAVAGL